MVATIRRISPTYYLTHIPHGALVETVFYEQINHDIQRDAALYLQLQAAQLLLCAMKSAPPGTLEIRAAVASEVAALSELARRSKAYWGYSAEFMRSCEEELTYLPEQIDNGDMSFFVGEADGRVGGFYGVRRTSPLEYELEALFVEPGLIGQGLGRALVDHAKSTVRSMGGECLLIQGDPHAEGFYRAVGGEQIGMRESASIPRRYLPLFKILVRRCHGA